MTKEADISIRIADELMSYLYDNHNGLSCGDYISTSSLFIYNMSQWIAHAMGESSKEVLNAIFGMAIKLESIHEGSLR